MEYQDKFIQLGGTQRELANREKYGIFELAISRYSKRMPEVATTKPLDVGSRSIGVAVLKTKSSPLNVLLDYSFQ